MITLLRNPSETLQGNLSLILGEALKWTDFFFPILTETAAFNVYPLIPPGVNLPAAISIAKVKGLISAHEIFLDLNLIVTFSRRGP